MAGIVRASADAASDRADLVIITPDNALLNSVFDFGQSSLANVCANQPACRKMIAALQEWCTSKPSRTAPRLIDLGALRLNARDASRSRPKAGTAAMQIIRLFLAAPHRLPFLTGTTGIAGLALWWTAYLSALFFDTPLPAQTELPGTLLHGPVMIYAAFAPFIFGFLLTVFPALDESGGFNRNAVRPGCGAALLRSPHHHRRNLVRDRQRYPDGLCPACGKLGAGDCRPRRCLAAPWAQ